MTATIIIQIFLFIKSKGLVGEKDQVLQQEPPPLCSCLLTRQTVCNKNRMPSILCLCKLSGYHWNGCTKGVHRTLIQYVPPRAENKQCLLEHERLPAFSITIGHRPCGLPLPPLPYPGNGSVHTGSDDHRLEDKGNAGDDQWQHVSGRKVPSVHGGSQEFVPAIEKSVQCAHGQS